MVEMITKPLNALRLKVTDRCAWNCWWCHNEGTGTRNPHLIGDVLWDESTAEVISDLKRALNFTEVHLTGGEPSAHPGLPEVVAGLSSLGLKVKTTTIGFHQEKLERFMAANLRSFNFSLHSIDSRTFVQTQVDRSLDWADKQLRQELDIIQLAKEAGAEVKINIVVANEQDLPRLRDVLAWASAREINLRILNELSSGMLAIDTILGFLTGIGAVETRRVTVAGSSSFTGHFQLPSGYEVGFKQIQPLYLTSMCAGCPLRDQGCEEKFYGVRLEKRKQADGTFAYFTRLCIHQTNGKTLLPVADFLRSPQLGEIQQLIASCPSEQSVSVG